MDSRETHFEIFHKRTRKAEWALVEAVPVREKALKKAKALQEAHPDGSVRVEKETYDPDTGQYQAVAILTLGDQDNSMRDRDGKTAEPPCTTPEDLHSVHARRTIASVLRDWLARERVTPLELLHRADLAEKLEGEGTMLQHAIQKTAIAQASEFEANVQHFVKRLNDLTEKSLATLMERDRKGKLPKVGKDGFGALADRLGEKSVYGMRAAVAGALKPARSWAEKVSVLLDLAGQVKDGPAADAALAVIDDFLAEAMAVAAASDSLAKDAEDLGARLLVLVKVAGGKVAEVDSRAAKALAARFAARQLPRARSTIIRRVLSELRRPQRLKPGQFWAEVELSRRLADSLIALAGPDLPPEDIAEAFIYRSGRLVQAEAVDEALADATNAYDEISSLLRLEEGLAGRTAKEKLAAYLRARLSAHKTEADLTQGPGKPLERAGRIAALQRGVLGASLPKEERAEIAAMLDRLCLKTLSDSKVFEAIAGGAAPPLDRAAALLKLAARGGLTRGKCQAEATVHAQKLVRQAAQTGAAEPAKLAEIKTLLGSLAA